MFLRSTAVKSGGRTLRYWKLVENYSTERGTRQRVVAHLGRLEDFCASDWIKLAERMGQPDVAAELEYRVKNVRPGRPGTRIAPLSPEEAAAATPVLLGSLKWEDPRQFGDVYAVLRMWRALGLGKLLATNLRGRSALKTCTVAAMMVANRVVAPDSELGMLDWLPGTALPELLGLGRNGVDANRLYRTLDALLPLKPVIEEHLVGAGRNLFAREYTAFLYDLTSTYFEGQAVDVPKARRGYSRDKRPDAKQVCIGLVVDWEGFPVGYEVYDGNVRDAATVQGTLAKLQGRFGDNSPIICMDRGMVTKQTMLLLRANHRYIVAERRETLRDHFSRIDHAAWQVVRRSDDGIPTIEVQELPPDEGERRILVRSSGCRTKEHDIRKRMTEGLSADMDALARRVREGRLKDRAKVDRAVGRILQRHAGVSRWLDIDVRADGDRLEVIWRLRPDVLEQAEAAEGLYVLRTNVGDTEAERLWAGYMTLSRVEAAFRHLKQELRLRPLFHYKESRVEAHILLSYLAYLVLWAIEHVHRSRGGELTGRRVLEVLHGIEIANINVRAADGRKLEIARISTPRKHEAEVLRTLGLRLPASRPHQMAPNLQMELIENGDNSWPLQPDSEIK